MVYLILNPVLFFVLNGSFFAIVQVTNIVLNCMALLPLSYSVLVNAALSEGTWCGYMVPYQKAWYQAAAFASQALYEFVLFLMSLLCLVRHLQLRNQSLATIAETLKGLVIRDNVLYFLLAFLSLSLSAISLLTDKVPLSALEFTVGFSTIFVNLGTSFQLSVLGPLMMLSIREYNVNQQEGGASGVTEVEMLEFAPGLCLNSESRL
ncbi:hypothetical protein CONPUDRAFT_91301 [Coniophora puteana RWD-64-598 SS2]|uniref:Uncharacterized protein n=1 Tax=Coniophora puteana (strain RWD-64-598) TaxID=741705 RepID=A0A5M3MI84_CONPW|nr:uncharacterized protein CONPUDRAFT_91301 [Coniophora puteana RWD-64-598 SS2]EIW78922.1 hypothetical protein CONPUDRAFT_91301 [Coniophora puteana RWD-64-598 SS2]